MYYEPYEQKILKIARIRDTIYKFRFLIMGIIALITGTVIALLSVKGNITQDVQISVSYVYGEEISPTSAKAFMSDVYYEYYDGEKWTREKPVFPGEYRVRAASKNGFGVVKYGAEVDFSILQKEISVSYASTTLTYGDAPALNVSGALEGDSFLAEEAKFDFGDYLAETTAVTLEKESFKIVNGAGEDVTRAYKIKDDIFEATAVKLLPRALTLQTESGEKTYDGTPLSVEKYTLLEGETVNGDSVSVEFTGVQTKYGESKNTVTATFFDLDGRDVSKLYRVSVQTGTLSVTKRPITVTVASPKAKVYDGKEYGKISWSVTEGTLANGETVTSDSVAAAYLNGKADVAKGAGKYVLDMRKFEIENKDGLTTSNYEVTFVKGALTVEKKPISILVDDLGEKVYDGYPHGEIVWKIDPATPLVSGESFSDECSACAVLGEEERNGRDVGEYVLTMKKVVLIDGEGNATTANYNVTVKKGTYKVTPRVLKLSVWNTQEVASAVYDGTVYVPSWSIDEGELAYGDEFTQNTSAYAQKKDGAIVSKVRDVGVYDYQLSVDIAYEDKSATANYTITVDRGRIEITTRSLIVTVCDFGTEKYNGHFYSPTYSVGGDSFADGEGLTNDSRLVAKVDNKEVEFVRDAAKYVFTFDVFEICKLNNEADVTTNNYKIERPDGGMEITKRHVMMTVSEGLERKVEYDGTNHVLPLEVSSNGDTLAEGEDFARGNEFGILKDGAYVERARDVGVYSYVIKNIVVCRSDDVADVTTQNYEFNYENNELEITTLSITVTVTADRTGTITYDGITYEPYLLETNVLVENEQWTLDSYPVAKVNGEITPVRNVGEYVLTMSKLSICRMEDDQDDTTDNYDITLEEEELVITKRPLTVTVTADQTGTITYDGITYEPYLLETNVLVENEQWTLDSYPVAKVNGKITSVRNVGEYVLTMSKLSICRTEDDQDDTTGNYDITLEEGELVITKRPLTVTVTADQTGTIKYDGITYKPYFEDTYKLVDNEQWAQDSYPVAKVNGEITPIRNVGEYVLTMSKLSICRMEDAQDDTTGNYNITLEESKLVIITRSLLISISVKDKIYDGASIGTSDKCIISTCSGDGVVEGESFFMWYNVNQDFVNAGTYNFDAVFPKEGFEAKVFREGYNEEDKDKDASMNYDPRIIAWPDTITIIKRPIMLEITSVTRPYDGTTLTSNEFSVIVEEEKSMSLVSEHTVDLKTGGKATTPDDGTVLNQMTAIDIFDGNGVSVKNNYEIISVTDGTLTVTQRKITLSPVSGKGTYNGSAFQYFTIPDVLPVAVRWTEEGDAQYGSALFDGSYISVCELDYEKDLVDAGEYENALWIVDGTVKILFGEEDITKYFDITCESANIVIVPRVIHIITHDIAYIEGGETAERTENDYHILTGSLVSGDTLKATFGEELPMVGASIPNRLEEVAIYGADGSLQGYIYVDEMGNVVDGNDGYNYVINVTFGQLTMQPEKET